MALTTDDVARLAALARIELTDQELERMAPELDIILEAVASVSEVTDADVPPMSHAMPLTNVFREDVVRPGLAQEQALAGAPATDEGKFLVPRILGEEA